MKNSLRFLVAYFCFSLLSCSGGVIGYGVVNWSTEEHNLLVGDIVPIYVRSNVAKAYIVSIDKSKKKVEIPLWQLTFFKSKRKAKQFKIKISDNLHKYAKVQLDGLPMRKDPENMSKQVYRLRENQVIKILWKGDGVPVLRNGKPLPGDWYKVMTNDGTSGWCFSLNLIIYDEREVLSDNEEPDILQGDNILSDVLSKDWYPESYAKMLAINKIDLENMSEEHGFFPGIKSGIARIVLPSGEFNFPYTKISKNDANVYKFDGSNLSMQVRGPDKISIQFTDSKGVPDVEYFVTLKTPPREIIETELIRRKKAIKKIFEKGPNFYSESYGSLQILEDGYFLWSGYKVISPSIIPRHSGSEGKVDIRYFVSPKMSSSYDGVISFKFDSADKWVNFLYVISENGLRLEFVSQENIQQSIVERKNLNPVILFFAPEGH